MHNSPPKAQTLWKSPLGFPWRRHLSSLRSTTTANVKACHRSQRAPEQTRCLSSKPAPALPNVPPASNSDPRDDWLCAPYRRAFLDAFRYYYWVTTGTAIDKLPQLYQQRLCCKAPWHANDRQQGKRLIRFPYPTNLVLFSKALAPPRPSLFQPV